MPDPLFFLTERDRNVLRRLIDRENKRVRTPDGGESDTLGTGEDQVSPGGYVGRAVSTITAMTGVTPGTGEAEVWRKVGTDLTKVIGSTVKVNNLGSSIAGATYFPLWRDRYGQWYATSPNVSGSGGGTNVIPMGWAASLNDSSCIRITSMGFAGSCDCGDPDIDVTLVHDTGLVWTSAVTFDVCGVPFTATLTSQTGDQRLPKLEITDGTNTYVGILVDQGGGYAEFSFGGALCTGSPDPTECGYNHFVLRAVCGPCPLIEAICLLQGVSEQLYLNVYNCPEFTSTIPLAFITGEWDPNAVLDGGSFGDPTAGYWFFICVGAGEGSAQIQQITSGGGTGVIPSYDPFVFSFDEGILGTFGGGTYNGTCTSSPFCGRVSDQAADATTLSPTIVSTGLGTAKGSGVTDVTLSTLPLVAGELLIVEVASFNNGGNVAAILTSTFAGLAEVNRETISVGGTTLQVSTFYVEVVSTGNDDVLVTFLAGSGDLVVKATAVSGLLKNKPERVVKASANGSSAFDTGTTGKTAWPDEYVHSSFAILETTGSFAYGTWASGFTLDEQDSVVTGGNTLGLTVGEKTISACTTLQGTKTSAPTCDWAGMVVSFV